MGSDSRNKRKQQQQWNMIDKWYKRRTLFHIAQICIVLCICLLIMDTMRKFHPSFGSSLSPGTSRRRRDKDVGRCIPWPMYVGKDHLPLIPKVAELSDRSNEGCQGLSSSIKSAFKIGFMDNWGPHPKVDLPKNSTSPNLNCSAIREPMTALSAVRMNEESAAFEQVRQCWHERTEHPFIFLRQMPINKTKTTKQSQQSSPSLELATKHGLMDVVKHYSPDCVEMRDNCIIPHTFRIAQDEAQCKAFFSNPNFKNMSWILKPAMEGKDGQDVRKVTDFQKDLVLPYSNCKPITTTTPASINNDENQEPPQDVLVQQRITPLTILGRAFQIRLFLLYKFASQPQSSSNNTNTNNNNNDGSVSPAQAWHIRIGNIHTCSENYTLIDDPTLGNWAMICNRKSYETNPRILDELGAYSHRHFYSITTNERPTYPYPEYMKFHLPSKAYKKVMKNIKRTMSTIAKIIQFYIEDSVQEYSHEKESSWFVTGIDLMIDEELKPYILDLDACPGASTQGDSDGDESRNSLIPGWRVMLTHYLREMLGDEKFDENDCENDLIERVL